MVIPTDPIEVTGLFISQKEFDELVKSTMMLDALNEVGVDNWEWYGDAVDLYESWVTKSGT